MSDLIPVEEASPGDSDFYDLPWVVECLYDGPDHKFPADWIFGGPNNDDPRADPRWRPTTYQYFDDRLNIVCTTQTPLCDDQAIDEFTKVAGYGPGFRPKYLSALRPGETKAEMLPWEYDCLTDMATEVKRARSEA